IFGLSKIGTRVIVAGDDVAPSMIEHAALWKPKAAGASRPVTTQIAYEPDGDAARPFAPDLRNWPERKALLDQLSAVAAAKAAEAEAAAPELDALTKAKKEKTNQRAKIAKALKRTEAAKKKADQWAEDAARRVAEAKTDKRRKSAEAEAAKAATAVTKAQEKWAADKAADDAAAAELQRATDAFDAADKVKKDALAVAQEAKRKTLPVSVFVSLKAQRVYVRQGHEPVLDMPLTIAEPEKEIGTHVYTAMDYANDGNDVRWSVVSLRPRPHHGVVVEDEPRTSRKKRAATDRPPPPTDLGPATAALDRVTLPPEIVAMASEYVWPGSSLIISDEELSKETGKATDFVVLISGEPQGGIKKRPRQPKNYYPYDPYYGEYYDYNDRYYDRRRRPRGPSFFSFW
ncbi:MAG: L,D-transpeptidase, partial [Rhizobiales bacterium]|nr:L,D-transpeptidase [Hyphomicrobiales bacterium]